MDKKRIVILIALWGRPHVFQMCASNLQWFIRKVKHEIEVVCVLSPEDPDINQLYEIVTHCGFKICYHSNNPVSDKHNAGIRYCYEHLQFDYLMNFGSDDLIHPDIFELYKKPFKLNWNLFGINSLYFHELGSGTTFHFNSYNHKKSIGAGRMISWNLIRFFMNSKKEVYESGIDRCLDGNSSTRILGIAGVKDRAIDAGMFPYIVDIKTETNITPVESLRKLTNKITYVKSNFIREHYKHVLL